MKGIAIWLLVVCAAVGRAQVEECPTDQATDWEIEMLLRHEDCNKFYKCTLGEPIEYQCYGNLFFNLDTWKCDWPENVDCNGRYVPTTTVEPTTTTTVKPVPTNTTTTTTTPEPTTITPPTPPTPESTTTTTTSTTITPPTPPTPEPTTTTTTSTTITPPTPPTLEPATTTTTSTTTTPPALEPETTTTPVPTTTTTTTTTARPTRPPTSTTTTRRPTTTSTTTTTTDAPTTTEEPEIEFAPNGCPVDPLIHWLLPNEEDCNKFYYCVWQQKVLRECPSGLHFNAVLQVCDWSWDAGCEVSFDKHSIEFRQMMKAF